MRSALGKLARLPHTMSLSGRLSAQRLVQPVALGRLRSVAVFAAKASRAAAKAPTISKLEWQSPLQVLRYPDPRLRAVNAKIGTFDSSLLALAKEMLELMYQDDGVGLAAPQVGVNVRLMVFNETGQKGQGAEMVLANPEIVAFSKDTLLQEEGCLSFPSMYGQVERPRAVRIRYQDEHGEAKELELSGWPARLFQHEFDHLQGALFHDRMKPAVLDAVRPQLQEMEAAFEAAHPGVKVQKVPAAKVNKGFGSK